MSLKTLFTDNVGLKITAVLLSVLLWFFVTSSGQSEMSVEVPIEFAGIPAGLGIAGSSNKTAVVSIRGQERFMKNVRPTSLRVVLDMGKAKKGEGTYYIGSGDVRLPYAISVVGITPASIKLRLDDIISKPVPVKPLIMGRPAEGYFVKSIETEPAEVRVSGLKSEVRRMVELKTEPIDITGIKSSLTDSAAVDITGYGSIKPSVDSVTVRVILGGKNR